MHEAFSDDDFDLATISEEDLVAIIEETGKEAISEDDAMVHVQDMLEEYANIDSSAFDIRIEDENIDMTALAELTPNTQIVSLNEEAQEVLTLDGILENSNESLDLDDSIFDAMLPVDESKNVESVNETDLVASVSETETATAPDPTVLVTVEEQIPDVA
jgi:hypothetical protein